MVVAYRRDEIPELRGPIGFVPTMGALHAGHESLINASVERGNRTIVSIYVNPSQFAPHEDFSRYPRTLEADLAMASACGASVVYVPSSEEIYPRKDISVLVEGALGTRWEAAVRPTHFSGVATVVLKLLNIVSADEAFFGQKDLQQCQVIQSLIDLLFLKTKLIVSPTVREIDGLAMSSRNRYLTEDERKTAPLLHESLFGCWLSIKSGSDISHSLDSARQKLIEAGFTIDYFSMVSLPDMESTLSITNSASRAALIAAAALGKTRLLDNVVW